MDQSLERRIRRLYSCFHSSEDRQGRSFVPLADAYRRAGDLLRARLLLEEGLRRHPDFASAHVVAMRIARDVSDHAGALAATRRVLELDPGNAEARKALARVGPLVEDAPASGTSGEGDADVPDESWMAGDAGVWAAGTDSGLASVDPVALEAEEEQVVAVETEPGRPAIADPEEDPAAGAEAEEEQVAQAPAAEAEEDPLAVAGSAQERAAPASAEGAGRSARPAGTPIETPAAASDAVADAGIYTRTMGRLYERQGLHAQAIAVYEQLVEAEPGDEALVSRLERLRRRPAAETEAPGEAEAVRGGETTRAPDVVPVPGDSLGVVPIEALAPDASIAGTREGAP